jgi:hypothetical protein
MRNRKVSEKSAARGTVRWMFHCPRMVFCLELGIESCMSTHCGRLSLYLYFAPMIFVSLIMFSSLFVGSRAHRSYLPSLSV